MRIQHNIMAMNAYRNYTTNTSALAKNLEKLSSGYKINRAGDDAAGLAISEKMRAQITGLETAQKNAKDGISLVQTAEGALTEVHDMLNRMVELAQQSANGTYDNETDRANLQKEMEQLKSEIDRIADSSNFNGIKLLDGSLSTEGGTTTVDPDSIVGLDTAVVEATKSTQTITLADPKATTAYADGDEVSLNIGLSDGTSMTVKLTVKVDENKNTQLVGEDGTVYKTVAATSGGSATVANIAKSDLGDAFAAALKDSKLGSDFKFTNAAGVITMEAKQAGGNAVTITSLTQSSSNDSNYAGGTTKAAALATTVKGSDDVLAFVSNKITLFDGTNADEAVFEINGQKFAVGVLSKDAAKLDPDVTFISIKTGLTDAPDMEQVASVISQKTGLDVEFSGTGYKLDGASSETSNVFTVKSNTTGTASKGGLTLQIGDTSDSYNQLTVSVQDMHTRSLGIDGIDIGTQAGAKAAVQTIKEAINMVSSVRGDLGATQNRLDHTINNLSVMQENIQDAESTIRDTDIADEMMAYTKNNILVQSAQAMLAQANQIPQGVLQLLQ